MKRPIRFLAGAVLAALLVLVPLEAVSAVTLGSLNVPDRVTLASANWHALTFPSGTDYLLIQPITTSATWTVGCTDGAAVSDDYHTLQADTTYSIAVHQYGRSGSFCIAGTSSAVVEIVPMVRGK